MLNDIKLSYLWSSVSYKTWTHCFIANTDTVLLCLNTWRIFTFLRWIPNIFHRVCWKHQNFHERAARVKIIVSNTRDVYRKKSIFLLFYTFIGYMQCVTTEKVGAENAKTKNQNICNVLTKKMHTHTWCFRSQIRKLWAFAVLKGNALSEWKSQR